jgi:hypothetical protein
MVAMDAHGRAVTAHDKWLDEIWNSREERKDRKKITANGREFTRRKDKTTADEHRFTQINSQKITKDGERPPFTFNAFSLCLRVRFFLVFLFALIRVHSRFLFAILAFFRGYS